MAGVAGKMNDSPSYGVRSVGDYPIQVNSGVLEEEQKFVWHVKQFEKCLKYEDLLRSQAFTFKLGRGIGLPAEFSVHLSPFRCHVDNHEWVGVFFRVLDFPEDVLLVNVQRSVKVKSPDGGYFFEGFDEFLNLADRPIQDWGFGRVLRRDMALADLPLIDGALVIEITFKLFNNQPATITGALPAIMQSFEDRALRKLSMEFAQHRPEKAKKDNEKNVTTLISNDGKEFNVCKAALSARSPVFRAMFQAEMQESKTGVVHINDLSGKTLGVLINYLYSGTLLEEWCSDEVLMELPFAASKYQLEVLNDFFDHALGAVCTKQNVKGLASIAYQLELKNASRELFSFIKNNATSLEDLMFIAEKDK